MNATEPSRTDLNEYRHQLESLADRLSGNVADLTAEATRPTGIEGIEADASAPKPTATSSEGDEEVARGILRSEEQILAEVRNALARFDAGTFGRCEQCAKPIAKLRLRAVPYARFCTHCAKEGSDR